MKKAISFAAGLMLVFACALSVNAQKVKIKGDAKALKGEKKIKIEYTYNNLKVAKGTEEEYIKDKREKIKEKGKNDPDKWEASWKGDREKRYQPKFEKLFNKHIKDAKIKVGSSDKFNGAKYTMKINTDYIDPGFNVGVMRKPALINLTIEVVETANPSNVLFTATVKKSPGKDAMGTDFDAGLRISEAYAKAGKKLAKILYKKHLK